MKKVIVAAVWCIVSTPMVAFSAIDPEVQQEIDSLHGRDAEIVGYTNANSVGIAYTSGRVDKTEQDIGALQQDQVRQDQAVQDLERSQLGQTAAIGGLAATQAIQANTLQNTADRVDIHDQQLQDLDSRMSSKWMTQQSIDNRQDREIGEAKNMAAAAYAAASLQYCTQIECGFQMAAGVANLNGRNAMAIGGGGALNERWFVSGNVVQAGSIRGVAASATFSFK